MKRWSFSVRQKLTVVVALCVVLPLLALTVWQAYVWKGEQIAARQAVLERETEALWSEAERAVELCRVSAQAVSTNTRLTDYLSALIWGKSVSNLDIYEFYNNDVASLERLVASNPDLYRLRIYTAADDALEMLPVVFTGSRLEEIGWSGLMPSAEQWWFNYTDGIFSADVTGLMALLTPLFDDAGIRVGLLEVSIPMADVFPRLFDATATASLAAADGSEVAPPAAADGDETASQGSLLDRLKDVPDLEAGTWVWETELDGAPALAAVAVIPELGTYCEVQSLTDLYGEIRQQQLVLIVAALIAVVVIWLLARTLVGQMLRQLYLVLDGVRAFSQGETEAEIPVQSRDEIGEFTQQINLLLGSIRDLIQRQIHAEMLLKNTEIRALQNQINAHFLYNVLEAIKMMAQIEGQREIAAAITNLSRLLRYTMGWKRPVVRLEEELEYIQHYLALVNLRYDGQMHLETDIPAALLNQAVPKVSLQPIVENTVVHGPPLREDRIVRLTARETDGLVVISVVEDGPPPSAEDQDRMRQSIEGRLEGGSRSGNGIGLHNIEERIQQTFGPGYGLEVRGGIIVTLPRRIMEEGAQH